MAIEALEEKEPAPETRQAVAWLRRIAEDNKNINRQANEHGHNSIAGDTGLPKGFKRKHNCLPKEKYMEIFTAEYSRINPRTAKEYNLKRSPHTPCWETVAIHNGAHGWRELLAVSGVKRVCRESRPTEITVVSHSPALERLAELLENRAK